MDELPNKKHFEEEIDLFEIFHKLWNRKFIIVFFIIISILIAFYYYHNQTDGYKVTLDISPNSESQFYKYINFNEVLSENPLPSKDSEGNETFYRITPQVIFNRFLSQYTQRNGIINALSQKPFIDTFSNSQNIEDMILANAKNFIISKTKNGEGDFSYEINFSWPHLDQIQDLGNLFILKTLIYAKEDILEDLKSIKEYTEQKNIRILETINDKINLLSFEENDIINRRLLFLNEQLSIAINLGIQYNSLGQGDISSTQLETDTLTLTSKNKSSTPYYLIGYEAIEEEIKNLQNLSEEDKLLLSDSYLNLIKAKREVENSLTSKKLENAISLFTNEDPKDWVIYNLSFAEISNQNKSLYFLIIISSLMGLSVGVIYVLISGIIRRIKEPN